MDRFTARRVQYPSTARGPVLDTRWTSTCSTVTPSPALGQLSPQAETVAGAASSAREDRFASDLAPEPERPAPPAPVRRKTSDPVQWKREPRKREVVLDSS